MRKIKVLLKNHQGLNHVEIELFANKFGAKFEFPNTNSNFPPGNFNFYFQAIKITVER